MISRKKGFTPSVIPANAGIQNQKNRGFTLIELLVVVAIIALLLSILTPALNSVKERAKRILCKNRLRQWTIAIVSYQAANGRLMFIPRRHGEGPFPHYMGMVKDGNYDDASLEAEPGEWDLFRINPYIGAFSKTFYPGDPADPQTNCQATELVACPNASGDFMVDWVTWNCEWDWDFNEPGYSYWVLGGMKKPVNTGQANNGSDGEGSDHIYRDLTMDVLSPSRLLMSEILSKDGGTSIQSGHDVYRYNHGKTGWSWFTADVVGHSVYSPNPLATGRSQAFGDGHIEWRDIPLMEGENLPTLYDEWTEDRWNGPGSGWIQRYNTSWY